MKLYLKYIYTVIFILSRLSICMLLLCLSVAWAQSTTPQTTDPLEKDTDGDGYRDGPDLLLNIDGVLEWRIGEDKNGNGKYEPEGIDGILGTNDDEYDPNNPASHPTCNQIYFYKDVASWHDADGDGISDKREDRDLNGVYEANGPDGIADTDDDETDFQDADTDDDGLSDGFEQGLAIKDRFPFLYSDRLDPSNPDSDADGLPDGLELGVKKRPDGVPLTLAGTYDPRRHAVISLNPYVEGRYTNMSATFAFKGQLRSCFVPAPDGIAMTDPSNTDTNYDDLADGEGVVIDDKGNVDFGGHDPGAGLVGHLDGCEPSFHFEGQRPASLRPIIVDGILDPEGLEHDVFKLVYQITNDEILDQSSIVLSNPNAFALIDQPRGIENVGGNFYIIRLRANLELTLSETTAIEVITNKNHTKCVYAETMPAYKTSNEEFNSELLEYKGKDEGFDSLSVQ